MGLVLVRGQVDVDLKSYGETHGILFLSDVPSRVLRALSYCCNVPMGIYIIDCDQVSLTH